MSGSLWSPNSLWSVPEFQRVIRLPNEHDLSSASAPTHARFHEMALTPENNANPRSATKVSTCCEKPGGISFESPCQPFQRSSQVRRDPCAGRQILQHQQHRRERPRHHRTFLIRRRNLPKDAFACAAAITPRLSAIASKHFRLPFEIGIRLLTRFAAIKPRDRPAFKFRQSKNYLVAHSLSANILHASQKRQHPQSSIFLGRR
jgi:hypothetical protein